MVRPKGFEPLTFWFVAKHSIQLSYERIRYKFNKMVAPAGIEPATQGFSVLCSTDWAMEPKKWRFRRESNSRSSAWQADVITATPRNHMVAGDGFEPTTSGLWAQRATELLHPAILQMAEEKGFEPLRRSHDLPVFKTGPFNQTWVFLQKRWCLRPDLNRHGLWDPQDFKSCASTNFATQAQLMVSRWRFELQTLWLKVKCSTDWANGANIWLPRLDSN